jgi:hypothetical protein
VKYSESAISIIFSSNSSEKIQTHRSFINKIASLDSYSNIEEHSNLQEMDSLDKSALLNEEFADKFNIFDLLDQPEILLGKR